MDKLLEYYKECFELMDCIHFNSEIAKCEYEKVLGANIGKTITITNSSIVDNRSLKKFTEKGLVVGFIGNDTPYKGLQILIKAIEKLNIDVMIWGGKKSELGRIHYRGKFHKNQIAAVYKEMDLLVVPSIWKETFSLVTLEAISYGVPVIVSDNVGAKVIIEEYDPFFVYHNFQELRNLLQDLVIDKSKLIQFNRSIISKPWKYDMKEHAKEIVDIIYKSQK